MSRMGGGEFTIAEEIVHAITHGLGAALGGVALSILVVLAQDAWQMASFIIYGVSLILLYLASTFYHSFQGPRIKHFFHIIDHSTIYMLIAGTYTPFTLITLRGTWGWTLFGITWGIALIGIIQKIYNVRRFRRLGPIIYILMGWSIVIAAKPLMAAIPPKGMAWLLAGGLSYTLGVLFYAIKKIPFNHAIWHLFVLGGSACHFFAILFYVLPA